MKFRIAFLLVGFVALVALFAVFVNTQATIGEGVTVAEAKFTPKADFDALPESASRVSYFFGGMGNLDTCYAFDISESEFLKMVAGLPRFIECHYSQFPFIKRYNYELNGTESTRFEDGVHFYFDSDGDGKWSEQLSIDRRSGRAFYHFREYRGITM